MLDRWLMIGTTGNAKLIDKLVLGAGISPLSLDVFAGNGLTQGMRLWAKQHNVAYTNHDFIKIKGLRAQKEAAKDLIDNADGVLVIWDGTVGLPEEVIELAINAEKRIIVCVIDNSVGKMITVGFEFDDF